MQKSVPMWIIVFTALVAAMALFLSYQSIGTQGWSFAARNAIPAVLTIAALACWRTSVIAFICVLLGRLTIELGDLITALTDPASPMVDLLPVIIVMIAVEVFGLYVLCKRLR